MHIFSLYLDERVFQSEYVMYRCDQMYDNLVKIRFDFCSVHCVWWWSLVVEHLLCYRIINISQVAAHTDASVVVRIKFISVFKDWCYQALIPDVGEVTYTQVTLNSFRTANWSLLLVCLSLSLYGYSIVAHNNPSSRWQHSATRCPTLANFNEWVHFVTLDTDYSILVVCSVHHI